MPCKSEATTQGMKHWLFLHACPLGHRLPQPPQLRWSSVVMQNPLQ